MTLKDLLTTYWSQATLVLVALGYLAKQVLDIKSKKIEINHSIFQQNRLMAIKNFFLNYSRTELMWHQLSLYEIFDKRLSAKEIDNIIFPNLNALQEITLELKLYFNHDDNKYFEQLTKGMLSINSKVLELWSIVNLENDTVVKVNDYNSFKEGILKNNKVIMDELCSRVKSHYR